MDKSMIQYQLIKLSEGVIPKMYRSELAELNALLFKVAIRVDKENEVKLNEINHK